MGIVTCGELGRAPLPRLVKKFGIIGERLKAMGNGKLNRPLEVEAQEAKSIGHSITLPKDIWDREEILSCLLARRKGRAEGTTLRPPGEEDNTHRKVS